MQIKRFFSFIFILFSCLGFSQNLTGEQLLEKAIAYHDPNNNWPTFKGNFHITMEIPGKPNRDSKIVIDLPNEFFSVKSKVNDTISEYIIDKHSITIVFMGDKNPSETILKTQSLSKERAKLYQNYYTYLYGLPIKLKDPGTIIHEVVEAKKFKGKNYLVLKATYEKQVGKDTWYFYFDPKTYAMEIYQFFHAELENDGEYILLSEEEIINGIKIPKYRAWYLNKDHTLLGTDILNP
ncbi:DUF6503 family protein [Hyunsoonleella pacifica]|uniref:Uncharacterized protein n=1 Tax=Hyunsoonleella pacifica TaxID=1080224 RepID=A0A4Q9FPN5_9FLAO|nr:DUF6503 family protein [Hyunsoonleella pacifica]TBN14619.1 hypothetical protein EYD46_13695 [Hyunsoonleella pacifica]GGD15312.1 hypothetical protein GCM10011368_16550 [Hyunsoonleella pacifica]